MPIEWDLKQWLAVKHQIYRPSELQALLEEKAGLQLSLQAISSLLNNVPGALRLSTMQALCTALNCSLNDFCRVFPDQAATAHHLEILQEGERSERDPGHVPIQSSVEGALHDMVVNILKEQGLLPRAQEAGTSASSTISILLPRWVWSVIPDLTRGIVEGIGERSAYTIAMYSMSDEYEQGDEHTLFNRYLARPLSAGLIAIFPGQQTAQLASLTRQGVPVVVIDDQAMHMMHWVGVDNIEGAYMAVRHLIGLGHRRIAHIQGPTTHLVSHARYEGYCRALVEAGILPDPQLVLEGDFLPPSGRACARDLFALPPEKRPTAIFAASDQMAYGVLAAAEEVGLSVPGDVALVGFDDDHPSAYTRPPLTTVRQPYFEMGRQSVALLLSLIGKQQASLSSQQARHIQLPAHLVVRESCGANYQSTVQSPPEPTIS
jgi:LacI family transcriptional regulator